MAVGSNYAAALRAAGVIYYPYFTSNFAPAKRIFIFEGVDLVGATHAAQVRTLPDAGGAVLLALTCTAVLVGSDTHLTIGATEGAIEVLPAAAELGRNAEFYWDYEMTPLGDVKRKVFAGEFVRTAGVNP